MSLKLQSRFDCRKRTWQKKYLSYDKHSNIQNIFIHPCCSLNRCMFNPRHDKTDSEQIQIKSRAYAGFD